jgi:DNA-binding NarL/FixJ family response regulator
MNEQLTVVMADDHNMVREALMRFVERLAHKVDVLEADNFDTAYQLIRGRDHVDLVLLDLDMPGMNEFDGLRTLHGEYPDMPIVILSGIADKDTVAEAMELGAAGYVPKTMVGVGLVGALTMVLNGERYVPQPSAFTKGRAQREALRGKAETVAANDVSGDLARLTQRQQAVLREVAAGRSNKEIARALKIEEITVKVHLQAIFRKLGVANRTQAATRAMAGGLIEDQPRRSAGES